MNVPERGPSTGLPMWSGGAGAQAGKGGTLEPIAHIGRPGLVTTCGSECIGGTAALLYQIFCTAADDGRCFQVYRRLP